jgi:hypothetical protein
MNCVAFIAFRQKDQCYEQATSVKDRTRCQDGRINPGERSPAAAVHLRGGNDSSARAIEIRPQVTFVASRFMPAGPFRGCAKTRFRPHCSRRAALMTLSG